MVVKHKIKMDLSKPALMPKVDVVQRDQFTRQLELSLYSGGEAWTIPEDISVIIYFVRSDGTGGDYDTLSNGNQAWAASGNVLTVDIAPPVMSQSGPVVMALDLIQGENRVSTFNILLDVLQTLSQSYTPSDEEVSVRAFIPMPQSAEVGQFFQVSKVDEHGRILRVQAVDMPGSEASIEEALAEARKFFVCGEVVAQTVSVTRDFSADSGISVDFNGNRLQGVMYPQEDTDAANKDYVDRVVSRSYVPSYWQDAVDAACEKVTALQDAGGRNAVSFVWFSDCHVNPDSNVPNPGHTGALAAAVMEKCRIPFAVMGGDAARSDGNGLSSENQMRESLLAAEKSFAPIGADRLLQVQGNHDGSWGYQEGLEDPYFCYQMDGRELYGALFREQAEDQRRVFSEDGSYFYVDHPASKTRFVLLNSNWVEDAEDGNGVALRRRMRTFGYGNVQLNWLAGEALHFAEAGWAVVIAAHVPPTADYDATYRDEDILRGILTAFAEGTSYSGTCGTAGEWDYVSVDCDYSSGNLAQIVGFFAGHAHKDTLDVDSYAYPVITITSDGDLSYDETEEERVLGTDNEHALDIVTIDRKNGLVSLTRLGVGGDRAFSIGDGAKVIHTITYSLTNCSLDKTPSGVTSGASLDAVLSINNGYTLEAVSVTMAGEDVTSTAYANGTIHIASVTGAVVITAKAAAAVSSDITNLADTTSADWANDSRLNSSASVVDYSGSCVTNWIACAKGDVIRISGLNILDSTSGYLCYYRNDTSVYESAKLSSYTDHFTVSDSGVISYTVFTISESVPEIWGGKLRFSGALTAASPEDIIITVNEEIQ